jgi:hypothetical protein
VDDPDGGDMSGECVRRAWLTLGTETLDLEDETAGYFCSSLDLGYPEIRDVVNNRPDQDGVDDRTMFYGKRVVTADVVAFASAGAQIDAVMSAFAPYMHVTARPVLHWILDRPGAAERVLTVRPSGYGAPIVGADQREIHLSWIAADPIVRDPETHYGTAWSGAGVAAGRTYDLTFPRTYPMSGGPGATDYHVHNYGDVPVFLSYRVYGPITAPRIQTYNNDGSGTGVVRFVAGFTIDANRYVDIDSSAKTAYLDGNPNLPVMASLDWISSTFVAVNPYLGPAVGANIAVVTLTGGSTSAITQVEVSWQDPYLT